LRLAIIILLIIAAQPIIGFLSGAVGGVQNKNILRLRAEYSHLRFLDDALVQFRSCALQRAMERRFGNTRAIFPL
jgi:hypothetical protein